MTPDPHAAQVAAERAKELAEQDLHAIALLLESPGWLYLSRRLNEERTTIRAQIADDDTLTHESTRLLRAKAATLADILALPMRDRSAHQATLAQARHKQSGPSRG